MTTYLDVNRKAYDEAAEEFKERCADRASGKQRIVKHFAEHIDELFDTPRMLELGPGDGYVSKLLHERGYNVTAIEFSERMAEIARETAPEIEIIEDEFLHHDFQDRRYSGIVALAFIHLFPKKDAKKVLKKIYNLLEQSGRVCMSTTKHQNSDQGYTKKVNFRTVPRRYRREYTKNEFEALLTGSGFNIISCNEENSDETPRRVWLNYILGKGEQ